MLCALAMPRIPTGEAEAGRSGAHDHAWIHTVFQVNLDHIGPCVSEERGGEHRWTGEKRGGRGRKKGTWENKYLKTNFQKQRVQI